MSWMKVKPCYPHGVRLVTAVDDDMSFLKVSGQPDVSQSRQRIKSEGELLTD